MSLREDLKKVLIQVLLLLLLNSRLRLDSRLLLNSRLTMCPQKRHKKSTTCASMKLVLRLQVGSRLRYCLLDRRENRGDSRWGELLREEGNSCRGNGGCYSLLGLKGVEGARLLCRWAGGKQGRREVPWSLHGRG